MEKIQGQLERPERNMLTEPMTTIEAMAQIEGPRWMQEQEALERAVASDSVWECSLPNALERIQKGLSATVYGKGGVNRWYIEPDGSISISRAYAQSDRHLERARELGFAIVP